MNALELLQAQHREIESLFAQLFAVAPASRRVRRKLYARLADALAVHAGVEERLFYPTVNRPPTEDLLLKAAEEHLSVKRLAADLLQLDPGHTTWEAKLTVLRDQILLHVSEEETLLFPKVRRLFDTEELSYLGEDMVRLTRRLKQGDPRWRIPGETDAANPIE